MANPVPYEPGYDFTATDNALVSGDCLVEANGTDYFEVYGTGLGVNNKTVIGTTSVTYFEGEAI